MPFFIRPEDLDTLRPTQVQRLFAEQWLSTLESKVPMSIGPRPLSTLSLLESVRTTLVEGQLRPNTMSTQAEVAVAFVRARPWLRMTYQDTAIVIDALSAVSSVCNRQNARKAIDAIDQLFDALAARRVSSHVEFILSLGEQQLEAASDEVGDLIADLVALGHSESFLYGWGKSVILGQTPETSERSFQERLAQFAELGKSRDFKVVFKHSKVGVLPHSDVLWFVKDAMRDFKSLPQLVLGEAEQAGLAKIRALDYKAAIAATEDSFFRYRESLAHSNRIERLALIRTEFAVRCEDDETELLVSADALRDYQPPTLIHGNTVWRVREHAPSVAAALERVLYWLAVSRRSRGEAEFVGLWLALVSLFQSEDTNHIAATIARCRVASLVQLHARWIAEYLGKAHRLGWQRLTVGDVRRFGLNRRLEHRLRPILEAAASDSGAFDRLGAARPYLFRRVQALRALCSKASRDRIVSGIESELRALLPWAKTVRHGVAHLGVTSITGLDLINHHLRDCVTQTYDCVAARALQGPISTVGEAHREFSRDFDVLVGHVLAEPCLSLLHVREGVAHTEALPLKYWVR